MGVGQMRDQIRAFWQHPRLPRWLAAPIALFALLAVCSYMLLPASRLSSWRRVNAGGASDAAATSPEAAAQLPRCLATSQGMAPPQALVDAFRHGSKQLPPKYPRLAASNWEGAVNKTHLGEYCKWQLLGVCKRTGALHATHHKQHTNTIINGVVMCTQHTHLGANREWQPL